jgi:hypothetical protein
MGIQNPENEPWVDLFSLQGKEEAAKKAAQLEEPFRDYARSYEGTPTQFWKDFGISRRDRSYYQQLIDSDTGAVYRELDELETRGRGARARSNLEAELDTPSTAKLHRERRRKPLSDSQNPF